MATLEVIYTFGNREQEFALGRIGDSGLKNKNELVESLLDELTAEEKADLCKISMCVYGNATLPDWYMDCSGKLYFEKRKLID